MSYLNKYLKYKNKYLSIKNASDGGASNLTDNLTKIKVLCVIDVQDCFLEGTMKSTAGDKLSEYKKKLFDFVKEKGNDYDVIIFSKDNHPEHHKSFGLYNPHCINLNTTYCGKKDRQLSIEALYENSGLKNNKNYETNVKEDKDKLTGKILGSNEGTSFETAYRYATKLQIKQSYLEETCNKTNIAELDLSLQIDESKGGSYYFRYFDDKEEKTPYIIRINKG